VVLVTGRRAPAVRPIVEALGGGLPLVLHNGALILAEDGVLRCRPLARAIALSALAIGRRFGADALFHCGARGEGRLLVEPSGPDTTLKAYALDRGHPDVTTLADFGQLAEDPIQLMFGGSLARLRPLAAALGAELGNRVAVARTYYPARDLGFLDVLAPGVGKAEAIGFLAARAGFEATQVMAIGDNWNDLEMLQQAGLGLLMGNADPELLACGLPVLPSHLEDGVAVGLERYLLTPEPGAPAPK